MSKTIILARQAQDKHRETTQNRDAFSNSPMSPREEWVGVTVENRAGVVTAAGGADDGGDGGSAVGAAAISAEQMTVDVHYASDGQ